MTQFISNNRLTTVQQQGLKHSVITNVEQEYGATASQLSEQWYDEGEDLLGGDFVMPTGRSLSEITSSLATNLGGSILFNHNVINIAFNATGVTVSG